MSHADDAGLVASVEASHKFSKKLSAGIEAEFRGGGESRCSVELVVSSWNRQWKIQVIHPIVAVFTEAEAYLIWDVDVKPFFDDDDILGEVGELVEALN